MQESLWKEKYRRLDFEFEGRKAVLVFPEKATRQWALKTEYFSAFQDLEERLVEKGFHLAYLENHNRWGTLEDLSAKRRFRDHLMEQYGLSPRCVPIGMSCGGLHAIKQAAYYPEMISALYLDAPVVNLLSCPFGMGDLGSDIAKEVQQECLSALSITRSQLLSYRDHPYDHLITLIRHRIPAVLICGEADRTVPFPENGHLLQLQYERSRLPFYFHLKPGCAHHPHGPTDEKTMQEAIDFLCRFG